MPGSDKLVQLRVNFGDHSRTVVAGLKQERVNPREIEGKQALFVVDFHRRNCAGSSRKQCSLTSATQTASRQSWLCRSHPYRMGAVRGERG